MAQNSSKIIKSWSFLAFARQFGAELAAGECVNHETGEAFKACTFTKDGKRTFVNFGPSLAGGLGVREMVDKRDGLQVVQLDVPAETIAKREAAGKQAETYVLCKQGETSWETVDLAGLL